MKITVTTPTIARIDLEDTSPKILSLDLTYRDKRAEYAYNKLKNNKYARFNWGADKYEANLADLKAQITNTLLMQDDQGYYTYTGLIDRLVKKYRATVTNSLSYPESDLIPWDHEPKYPLRPYQKEAVDKLLEHKHAAIEMATGAGKSLCLVQLAKELGLPTIIVAPTTNIANQLLKDFLYYFGKRYVGQYYGGKKQIGKLFTVAIGASLIRVEKGSEDYEFFSNINVLCVDESHLIASDTLSYMCLDLFQNTSRRFFVSATQMRTDGLDLLLEGITGPVVYEKALRELVKEGYLAEPKFKMVQVQSPISYVPKDPMKVTQKHLYYNSNVNRICGDLVNKCVENGRQTLILVDEIEQFVHLLPHFRYHAKFAYGTLTKDNIDKVPKEYHKADPTKLIEEFNEFKFPILVGTSAVSVGSDFKAVGAIHYLMGGTSEIQVSQAVGRGTRGGFNGQVYLQDGAKKLDCWFFDYDVNHWDTDSSLLTHRHALARKKVYKSLFGTVFDIKMY